jgi:hypothetical protein
MFSDTELGAYVDASLTVRSAAGSVWAVKASRYAGLVDVTEGSSSRKNSQLHAQALKMAEYYAPSSTGGGGSTTTGRSGTRAIVRPS